jgi:hypothetical protein
MDTKKLEGRLVILTRTLEQWYHDLNNEFNIPITNRIAKVVKVFDWDTEEGKLLLEERAKTGKWDKLDPKDFRYVLKIYYPELHIKNTNQVMIEEVVPLYYPGTKNSMFYPVPSWMLQDLVKEEKAVFKVTKKAVSNSEKI